MKQFTLKQMFVATAWFAFASLVAARLIPLVLAIRNPPPDVEGPSVFFAMGNANFLLMAFTVSVGAGIGSLFKQTGWGIVAGMCVGFIPCFTGCILWL